ncbi:MAG: M24 family metallopeptidase [Gammaproteobacteria bacterium]
MLLNQSRAIELMERDGLDGLVAVTPLNTYYLSDYWGMFNTPGGYDAAYVAMLPRDPAQPAALVVPALEIRRLETKGGSWMPNVFAHSHADGERHFEDGTRRGADYAGWPVRPGADLGDLESRWTAIVRRLGPQMSTDAFQAVARALTAAGLGKARLGTDDPRLAGWLQAAGLARIECRYQPQLFNEIRLVKTPREIELLTLAARANETALLASAAALREGSSWDELETVYLTEMLRQGARGVYLSCGVGELPHGRVRAGEPVMFDALGHVARYHGDFGRCAVVGEPSAGHRKRHRAIALGWEAAQEYLRPGVRYSELARAVATVVRREGIPDFREPLVHSLGLEHTDDPKPAGAQPQTRPDQVLRENMVINVDMPHTEIGWGSVHMEDTVQITADGCRRLGVADFSLRVVTRTA